MTNYDVLKQMPVKSFANMVFSVARNDCQSLADFENFLKKEIPEDLEGTTKKALQNLQCPNNGKMGCEKDKQTKSKIKEAMEDIKDWIEWNVTPTVILSAIALLISIASATLSIGRLIQYLISH